MAVGWYSRFFCPATSGRHTSRVYEALKRVLAANIAPRSCGCRSRSLDSCFLPSRSCLDAPTRQLLYALASDTSESMSLDVVCVRSGFVWDDHLR